MLLSFVMMAAGMLLQGQCQRLTLEEDPALLSKTGFLVTTGDGQQKLWWSLDFLFDKFKANGETRKLFKWLQFFQAGVASTELCSDELFCHTRQTTLPVQALHENVATTSAIVAFFFYISKESRTSTIMKLVQGLLSGICNRAGLTLNVARNIPLENLLPLTISPAGLVTGLEEMLSTRHRTCFVVWQKEWQNMFDNGDLCEPLTSEENVAVTLQELVKFTFSVEKRRRTAGAHPWRADSAIGTCLRRTQKALVDFLAHGLDAYVTQVYMAQHDTSKIPPSRRRLSSHTAEDTGAAPGQVVQRRKRKVCMNPEAIFELLSQERDTSVTMRQALGLLHSTRLSQSAGCSQTAVDSWQRRTQEIYDSRAALSMTGAMHFNLISDASTHAGKELLVSILWSHQAQTAAFANNQVILPMSSIAPSEMELTSLVEQLAQDESACF